jgi:signal transduction histidine kinase/DNA-binding response OmpR family regulator
MSIRSKFVLISISIALICLLVFSSVVYDRAVNYKHLQEAKSYHVLAEQYLQLTLNNSTAQYIRSILGRYITSQIFPAVMYATLDKKRQVKFLFERENFKNELITQVIPVLKEKNNPVSGQFVRGENVYYWLLIDLSSYKVKDDSMLIAFPLSESIRSEVLKFFGLPFLVASLLFLWMMIWVALITSSLVLKLEQQKQILNDQAGDIEKSRDEALLANSAKSNFLANMSHEIRSPLTSILGFAESSMDIDQSMDERSKATETIIRSGKHLMHIINEILDLSKIESGKFEIELMPVSLLKVLDEIKGFVAKTAEDKGLTFDVNYFYPLPEEIITDQLRLKQILLNLCSNAIKFTDKGHVYLNVGYKPESSSLIFEVIDTGIGMTTEQKEKIFKPFEQADSSITRKFGGTGLGLTLSKQLINMLNGEISVESKLNEGSRFIARLEIPRDEIKKFIYEKENEDLTKNEIKINLAAPCFDGKVLVAEDNPDIQELVKLLLKRVGIDADIVGNGQLAVERALASSYDLIFMDMQMPVLDGISAMKMLKQQGCATPVVAMTANAMKKDRDDCIVAGFSAFVSKPIDRNELYLVLKTYIKSRKISERNNIMLTSSLLNSEPDLIDLIDKFMLRLPVMQASVNLAHAEKNNEEFSGLIHQLKGVGGGYGYPMLTELCAKIEFQVASNEVANINLLIQEFNAMVKQILAGNEENHKIAERAKA